MRTSEQINELALALANAQSKIRAADRDAVNPFFKSKYATLDSVWSACREHLTDNGLAVIQSLGGDDNHFYLETMLVHSSGQYLSDTVPVTPTKDDIQGLGSALTYTRRYALASLVGITTDEDDDGNSSTQQQQKPQPAKRQGKKSSKATSQQNQAQVKFFADVQEQCQLNEKSARLICQALKIDLSDPAKYPDHIKTLCAETESPSCWPSLIVAANRKTNYYYARNKSDLMSNQFHVKGSVEKLHPDIVWPKQVGNPKSWSEALVLAIEYAEANQQTQSAEDDLNQAFPRDKQPALADMAETMSPDEIPYYNSEEA